MQFLRPALGALHACILRIDAIAVEIMEAVSAALEDSAVAADSAEASVTEAESEAWAAVPAPEAEEIPPAAALAGVGKNVSRKNT